MLLNSTSPNGLLDKVRDFYSDARTTLGAPIHSLPGLFCPKPGLPQKYVAKRPTATCRSVHRSIHRVVFVEIPAGPANLYLGCGGGNNSLVAAGKIGPAAQVYGVDFSISMLSHTRAGTSEADVELADPKASCFSFPTTTCTLRRATVSSKSIPTVT